MAQKDKADRLRIALATYPGNQEMHERSTSGASGATLRNHRVTKLQMTAAELAAVLEIHPNHLLDCETGRRPITADLWSRVRKVRRAK